jgi:hypothetical protein
MLNDIIDCEDDIMFLFYYVKSPASSTTKSGRHDIAEILLKVTLNTKIQYTDIPT